MRIQENLKMQLQKDFDSAPSNDIFEYTSPKQIEEFWKHNMKNSMSNDKIAKVAIKNKIGHSLPKWDRNQHVFEWIIQGIQTIDDYINEARSASAKKSTETEESSKTMCLLILSALEKAVEMYYSKPNPELQKVRAQLEGNLKIVRLSLEQKIQLPGSLSAETSQLSCGFEEEEVKLDPDLDLWEEARIFTASPVKRKRPRRFEHQKVSVSEKWTSKYLRSEYLNNLEGANEISPKRRKSRSPVKHLRRDLNPELANQIGDSPDLGILSPKKELFQKVSFEFSPVQPFSPRKRKNRINSKDDDAQSTISETTRFTEGTIGKLTPQLLEDDRRYVTRFSIREEKRLFGPRIKICEDKNTYKSFYKRRMITTDFEHNPRFDPPLKEAKKSVGFGYEEKDPNFHLRLRKREAKKIIKEVREIKKQTPGILKSDPLKSQFW